MTGTSVLKRTVRLHDDASVLRYAFWHWQDVRCRTDFSATDFFVMVFQCGSFFFYPMVDEPTCQADLAGYGWQRVASEPSTLVEFGALQMDVSSIVFGSESHHQSAGIRPRLRSKVAEILDLDLRFLHHFAVYALFQCFGSFDKASHQTEVVLLEFVALYEQYLLAVVACDGYDDGCGQ